MAQTIVSVRFRRSLDTIMEAKELLDEEDVCRYYSAVQKTKYSSKSSWSSIFNQHSKTQQVTTLSLRRSTTVNSATRVSKTVEGHKVLTAQKSKSSFAETPNNRALNTADTDCGVIRGTTSWKGDTKQCRVLFPEFFSPVETRNEDLYCYRREMKVTHHKLKEDPLVRSWLNLYGAHTSITP